MRKSQKRRHFKKKRPIQIWYVDVATFDELKRQYVTVEQSFVDRLLQMHFTIKVMGSVWDISLLTLQLFIIV